MTATDDTATAEASKGTEGSPNSGDDAVSNAPVETRKQVRREQRRVLLRSPGFIIGGGILLFWILSAVWPELLATWGEKDTVFDDAGVPQISKGPSGDAWFGTDRLGRDVYSRVIFGARSILIAAPIATIIAAIVGTLVGLATGYYRGWVDEIVSRFLEAILSIPAILLSILIVFTFGKTTTVIVGAIAFLFVPPVARTIRAATLAEAQLDYVTAARMRGENSLFIIAREIFPNVVGVVIVEITVRLGYAVFTISTLAFLGLSGGNVTNADWGVDVSQNFNQIVNNIWWPTIFPSLAIASLVIAVNLVADAIDSATSS